MLELHSVTSDFPRQFICTSVLSMIEKISLQSVLNCTEFSIWSQVLVHQIEAFSSQTDFETSRKKFCWVIVAKMACNKLKPILV